MKNKPTLPKKVEIIAMNIVHQIGDVLYERGIITSKQRQETNDLFIDFVGDLLAQALADPKKELLEDFADWVGKGWNLDLSNKDRAIKHFLSTLESEV